jgi:8-hydroxy-5-deazaflavin:NADPH oxidoreductase
MQTKPKIAVIGKGNVGGALAGGLERAGYEVRLVGNDLGKVPDTAAWGEAIILAIPFAALDDVVRTIGGAASGKTVVDWS